MKKKVLAVMMAVLIGTVAAAGCGGASTASKAASTAASAAASAAESTAESMAEESTEESTEESMAESTAESAADPEIADITSRLVGIWQDGAGNYYNFSEDYTYEGYDPETESTRKGAFSLVTDGDKIVLSIQAESNTEVSQYYVEAAEDYSTLVLTDVTSGEQNTLTPVTESGSTAESAADPEIADITSKLVGIWQDGAGNYYNFSEDNTYEGYDPETDSTRKGAFSLVTDGDKIVLSIQAESSTEVSQYYVEAAEDYSTLVLTDVTSGDQNTLTPVQS